MKSELCDLIFLSEKRTKLLHLLEEGPKNMEAIQETLSVTSTSMLPQIKMLKDKNLVIQKDKFYELSVVGKIIVRKTQPFISTLEVFEANLNYWAERDLRAIPPFLRKRLGELKNCKLIQPNLSHMFELEPEFLENLHNSRYVYGASAYFHPAFVPIYQELVKKGTDVSFLLTDHVLERFLTDYKDCMHDMLEFENFKLFVSSGDMKLAGLTVTDKFMLIFLFPENQSFDRESLMSFEPEALKWGKELFDYLQKNAKQIRE